MTNILELLKNEKVEWKKLGEVAIVGTGKSNANEQEENGLYPFYVRSKIVKRINKYEFDEEAIIIPGEGGIGEIFHYVNGKYALHQRAYRIHLQERIVVKYVYYYMKTHFKEFITKNMVGSTVTSIRKPMIENFEIPIPSLETQQKIVEILDNFTNYVTELQSELQSRSKQYTHYRDMLLSEEYLNKVTKEMEKDRSVSIVTLGEIGEFTRGNGLQKKDFQEEGNPVIHYGQIYTKYSFSADKVLSYVSDEIFSKLRKAQKNDILIATTSENIEDVGKSVVWLGDEEIGFSGDMYSYRTKQNPKFIAYFFQTNDFQKQKERKVTGTKMIRIHSDDMKNFEIPLPSLSLQNKIVKILDKFQIMLADTKGLLPEEIGQRQKQYEYYREKLLTFDKYCDSTHARTLILSNYYYEILHEVARFIQIDIDDKVEKKMLKDIGEFINGSGMPKTTFDEKGEVGAIHYGHIYTNYNLFVISPIVKVNKKISERLKKVNYGDIVIAKTSENIEDILKSVAYLGKEEAVVGGHAAVYKHKQNPKYLSYIFNGSIELIKQKNRLARGVKVIEISSTEMGKIVIPLPPFHVQQHIVSILDKFDTLVNDIKEGLPKEIELRQKQYEYWREQLLSFNR